MSDIYKPKRPEDYLDEECRLEKESKAKWKEEYQLFTELSDLFEQLSLLVTIKTMELQPCSDLFLATHSQMMGIVSLLLKRRLNDAQALTRRAIEATATAYRLFLRPDLVEIYLSAYSELKDLDDPKHWKPSRQYREKFKTTELFKEPAEFWRPLQVDYAMFSALSTHAGLGAIVPHKTSGGKRVLPYFEYEDRLIANAWYQLLGVYWQLLRVYLQILRNSSKLPAMIGSIEEGMKALQEKARKIMNARAPWIQETALAWFSGKS